MCSAPCEGGEAGSRLTIPLMRTHVLSLAQHTTTKLFTANSCKAKCGLIVVLESRTGKLRCYRPLLRKAAEHKPKETVTRVPCQFVYQYSDWNFERNGLLFCTIFASRQESSPWKLIVLQGSPVGSCLPQTALEWALLADEDKQGMSPSSQQPPFVPTSLPQSEPGTTLSSEGPKSVHRTAASGASAAPVVSYLSDWGQVQHKGSYCLGKELQGRWSWVLISPQPHRTSSEALTAPLTYFGNAIPSSHCSAPVAVLPSQKWEACSSSQISYFSTHPVCCSQPGSCGYRTRSITTQNKLSLSSTSTDSGCRLRAAWATAPFLQVTAPFLQANSQHPDLPQGTEHRIPVTAAFSSCTRGFKHPF